MLATIATVVTLSATKQLVRIDLSLRFIFIFLWSTFKQRWCARPEHRYLRGTSAGRTRQGLCGRSLLQDGAVRFGSPSEASSASRVMPAALRRVHSLVCSSRSRRGRLIYDRANGRFPGTRVTPGATLPTLLDALLRRPSQRHSPIERTMSSARIR